MLVFFLGIYFAFAPEPYLAGIIRLFPIPARARTQEILSRLATTLRRWLIGQVLSMTVVGVLIGVG